MKNFIYCCYLSFVLIACGATGPSMTADAGLAGQGGEPSDDDSGGAAGVGHVPEQGGQGGKGEGGAAGSSDAGIRADVGVPPDVGSVGGAGGSAVVINVTPAEQKATMMELSRKVCRTNVTYDNQDNVVAMNFSNHGVNCAGYVPSGLTDEDMLLLLKLPALRRVRFEAMGKVTSKGYGVIAKMPLLEAVLFAYPDGADRTFMLSVKDLANLKLLELKHMFSTPGTSLEQMPAFANLRVLELDNASSTAAVAVPFIVKHPDLISLQIHRTNMTNDDIAKIAAAVPNLQGVELKPNGASMDGGVFVHVAKWKKLRVLQVVGGLTVPAWDAGGSALAALTNLKVISGPVAADTKAKLKELIPGLGFSDTGPLTPEQQGLLNKDNPEMSKQVIPWFVTGRKEEYRHGEKQAKSTTEDIG